MSLEIHVRCEISDALRVPGYDAASGEHPADEHCGICPPERSALQAGCRLLQDEREGQPDGLEGGQRCQGRQGCTAKCRGSGGTKG